MIPMAQLRESEVLTWREAMQTRATAEAEAKARAWAAERARAEREGFWEAEYEAWAERKRKQVHPSTIRKAASRAREADARLARRPREISAYL